MPGQTDLPRADCLNSLAMPGVPRLSWSLAPGWFLIESVRPRILSPLPLAGEVDALDRARRVGKLPAKQHPLPMRQPHPDPPRKRRGSALRLLPRSL